MLIFYNLNYNSIELCLNFLNFTKMTNTNIEEKIKGIYVVLTVGGEGTRMYPLTLHCPKPLIDMCNYPIIKRICEIFIVQGCRKFIFASKGYENSVRIKEVMGLGRDMVKRMQTRGIEISDLEFNYAPKYDDKGSADATKFAAKFFNINSDMIIVGGDQIMDMNIEAMLKFHYEKNALMTIGLLKVDDVSQYGVAELNEDGRIIKFVEKPKACETKSNLANIGVYILSPKIREIFEKENIDVVKDFGKDLIPYLVNNNYEIYGFSHEYYWNDVGTPDRYLQTTADILNGKLNNIKFNKNEERYEMVWIKEDTYNRLKAQILTQKILLQKPLRIGKNCDIEDALIENSVIGDSVIIHKGCKIANAVIGDFTLVEENCTLNKCIIGKHTTIGKNSRIDADVNEFVATKSRIPVIGDETEIYPNSTVGPGKRVACIADSYKVLATGKFTTLGMDAKSVYFIEKE